MTDYAGADAIHSAALAATPEAAGPRLGISHVAGAYRRYPGEDVTLFTRVEVKGPLPGFRLQIVLPEGLALGDTRAPDGSVPQVSGDGRRTYLTWTAECKAGVSAYEYQVMATVRPVAQDVSLRSTATVTAAGLSPASAARYADAHASDTVQVRPAAGDGLSAEIEASETVSIAVSAKGRYLRYLPALYEQDELMGRFLMLFESMLQPIESRIAHLPLYFDPQMAPAEFLPWLGSWLGLVLDERWPEARRRELIRSAVTLYRRRGTRRGLLEYLRLLGEEVDIVEHFGDGLRLGSGATLGPHAVLGKGGSPHRFTVIMHLPQSLSQEEEPERVRIARSIIEAEKPVHTEYELQVEYDRAQELSVPGKDDV